MYIICSDQGDYFREHLIHRWIKEYIPKKYTKLEKKKQGDYFREHLIHRYIKEYIPANHTKLDKEKNSMRYLGKPISHA